jgi:two-component system response regulator ChvI
VSCLSCPHCGYDLVSLETFTVGDLSVIDAGNLIYWKNERVSLSPSERVIVTALARSAGRLIRRYVLADAVGYEGDDLNIVAVFLTRIKRSFRNIDDGFNQIESVWGLGVRWRAA